ncbi:MAG: 8-hydroxy-5-deazaflavin:NADPH oxidoreductase [Solirubrobacteraceae bacterium]|nr:8-hydroxy-5-deazaflavin:NADPH oxidoreductase [Solirubrobacteraceae bacterium]
MLADIVLVDRLGRPSQLHLLAPALVGGELLGRLLAGVGRGHTPTLYSAAVPPAVSIIGASGALGFGLAVRLGATGVAVTLGSRDGDRAAAAAGRARQAVPAGTFEGRENGAAAAANELVILCVPFRNQSETLTNLKAVLGEGQILLDATVPLAAAVSGRATRMLGVWQGSAAQQAQEMAPDGVRVVSGLHTVSAASLTDLAHPLDDDVLLCGDRREDKQAVAAILDRIDGLRCVDAGRLEMSRITESLTALMISVNSRHRTRAGIRITGLPARLP